MKREPIWNQSLCTRVLFPLAVAAVVCVTAPLSAPAAETGKPTSEAASPELPKEKQTTLGLYLTSAQAYDIWKGAPDKITIIDVRTPEEYAFVGHAEMAWNIPLGFVTYERKNGKTDHGVRMNPDFVAEVRDLAKPSDTLLVMCRSGGRSAMAVNALAKSGFTNVYNITDGFEGDKVKDTGSVFYGKRMRNGWKNSAPWTYSLDPEKIILEEGSSKQTDPK